LRIRKFVQIFVGMVFKCIATERIREMMMDIQAYKEIVEKIYRGLYEEASVEIRSLREKNSFIWNAKWSLMQTLLAARIALKSGQIPENIDSLEPSVETPLFLAAEIYMLKAIVLYQSGRLKEGINYYMQARSCYQSTGHKNKELLCQFNILIGETHVVKKSLHDFLQDFRLLQAEAESCGQFRILGLVYRQKSYLYKEDGKINAALFEAEKSMRYLELYCAASDFQLGLLNIAEILLELEMTSEAKKYYEMLLEPIDRRVLFAKTYIEMRLFGSSLNEEFREQSCPHFLQRYAFWQSRFNLPAYQQGSELTEQEDLQVDRLVLSSDSEKLYIKLKDQCLALRRHCLESKLIEILKQGPQSKALICEKLWPEYSDTHHLDNRLHRLISRINKKVDGLVLYSSKTYKLWGSVS
jgi:tetratricopeptide (TPR) repeat protein